MKICIIGNGTASAIALLQIFAVLKKSKQKLVKNLEVHCIHDPNITPVQVGETSTSLIYELLYHALNFDIVTEGAELDCTTKWSVRYFWEEANGKNFIVRSAPGINFNSDTFSKFTLKRLTALYNNFKEIHDTVIDIKQDERSATVFGVKDKYNYDFVIDCMGTPTPEELNSKEYLFPDFKVVNSVILYPEIKENLDKFNFTGAYVHKNGWMFSIPLQHRTTWGYLYNNNITSEEEAIEHFSKIKNIDASKLRRFSWEQYYKKNAMDNRILYLGNKLHFFEPHMSLPLHFYTNVMQNVTDYILRLNWSEDYSRLTLAINEWYVNNIEAIQSLLAINYAGPNNIKSSFWEYAKPAALNRLNNCNRFKSWAVNTVINGKPTTSFWKMNDFVIDEYIKGYQIDLTKFVNV